MAQAIAINNAQGIFYSSLSPAVRPRSFVFPQEKETSAVIKKRSKVP